MRKEVLRGGQGRADGDGTEDPGVSAPPSSFPDPINSLLLSGIVSILYSCFKNVTHFLSPGTTASRRCSTPLARRVSRVRSTLSSRYFHRNTLLSEKHLVDLHKLLQQHMLDGDVSSRGFKIFYSNKNLWWMSG